MENLVIILKDQDDINDAIGILLGCGFYSEKYQYKNSLIINNVKEGDKEKMLNELDFYNISVDSTTNDTDFF